MSDAIRRLSNVFMVVITMMALAVPIVENRITEQGPSILEVGDRVSLVKYVEEPGVKRSSRKINKIMGEEVEVIYEDGTTRVLPTSYISEI